MPFCEFKEQFIWFWNYFKSFHKLKGNALVSNVVSTISSTKSLLLHTKLNNIDSLYKKIAHMLWSQPQCCRIKGKNLWKIPFYVYTHLPFQHKVNNRSEPSVLRDTILPSIQKEESLLRASSFQIYSSFVVRDK